MTLYRALFLPRQRLRQINMSRGAIGEDGSVRLQSSDGETFEVSVRVARLSRTIDTMLRDLGHEPDDLIPLPKVNARILKKILGWAEHEIHEQLSHHQPQQDQRASGIGSTPSSTSPASHVHVPSSSSSTATGASSGSMAPPTQSMAMPPAPTPFQPRPQPYVPQRSSRQLRPPPPPRHMLTDWENEFISKNKDELYDLLLAANYLDIKSLLDILCRTVAEMIKGKDPEEIRRRFHASNPAHLAASDTPPSSPGPSPLPHPHSHLHHSSTTLSSEDTRSCSSVQENDTHSVYSNSSGQPHAEQLPGARETPV